MSGALNAILACCDEDRAARDYASRQMEIRSIARAGLAHERELLATLTQLCFVIRTGGDVLKACEGAEALIGKMMEGV